jgi:hypothetical protein
MARPARPQQHGRSSEIVFKARRQGWSTRATQGGFRLAQLNGSTHGLLLYEE